MTDIALRFATFGASESVAQTDRVAASLRRMGVDTEEAGGKARLGLGTMASGLKNLAGFVGITGAAFGIKDLVDAGIKLQNNQTQLEGALKAVGITGEAAYKKIDAAVISSSEHGGFEREQQFQSITQFVRSTQSATKALKDNAIAVDLARGAQIPYISAQRYIGQAIVGNVKRLQQYVGVIEPVKQAEFDLAQAHKETTDQLENQEKALGKAGPAWLRQQELLHAIIPVTAAQAQYTDKLSTAQKVLWEVQQRYAGSMAIFNNETAGRLSNLKNEFAEVTGGIGEDLLPAVNRLIKVAATLVDWLDRNKKAAEILGGVITGVLVAAMARLVISGIAYAVTGLVSLVTGETAAALATAGLSAVLIVLNGTFLILEVAVYGVAAAFAFLVDNPIVLVLVAIGIAIYELITHFRQVKNVAIDAWHSIESGASQAGHWISTTFNKVVGWIEYPFKKAWEFVSGVFDSMKHAATSAVSWIKHAFSTIGRDTPLGVFGNLASGNLGGALHSLTFGQLAKGGKVRSTDADFKPRQPPRHLYGGGPSGTDTVEGWLSPGEYVLNRAVTASVGTQALDSLNAGGGFGGLGGGGQMQIVPGPVIVNLDSRRIAQGVVRYTLQRAARGPSSFSGGSLMTAV